MDNSSRGLVTAARAFVRKGSSSSVLSDVHGFGWVRVGLMLDKLLDG